MKQKKKSKILRIVVPIFSICLFVLASYLSHRYAGALSGLINEQSAVAMVIYVLMIVVAVIIAPLDTLPLLPVAATVWGPSVAAVLTTLAYTVGSMIVFFLARRYGRRLAHRFKDKYHLKEWGRVIPKKKIFWLLAFARFLLPVDIISYAVALFTDMGWFPYLLASIIGILPFALLFAYGSQLKLGLQIAIAMVIIFVVIFRYQKIKDFFRTWAKEINI